MISYRINSETLNDLIDIYYVKKFIRLSYNSEDVAISSMIVASIKQAESYLNNYITKKTVTVSAVGEQEVRLKGINLDTSSITSVTVNDVPMTLNSDYSFREQSGFFFVEFINTILDTDIIKIVYSCDKFDNEQIKLYIMQLVGNSYSRNDVNPIVADNTLVNQYRYLPIA